MATYHHALVKHSLLRALLTIAMSCIIIYHSSLVHLPIKRIVVVLLNATKTRLAAKEIDPS